MKMSLKEAGVLATGILGITLGVAGLLAYLTVQDPNLRPKLGLYNIVPWMGQNETETVVSSGWYSPNQLVYAAEIALTIIGTLIGIMVNALLVYGVAKSSRPFFLPWMVYQVLLLIGLVLSTILILLLIHPAIRKTFAIVPFVLVCVVSFLWIKTWELHRRLGVKRFFRAPTASEVTCDEPIYATAGGGATPAAAMHWLRSCRSAHQLVIRFHEVLLTS